MPQLLSSRILAVTIITLALDQLTKLAIRSELPNCSAPSMRVCGVWLGPLQILRADNPGSSLTLVQGVGMWLLVGLGIALLAAYGWRLGSRDVTAALAVGLQVGGACGNLVDRLIYSGVTDFLSFGPPIVFNIADLALGAGMLLAAYSLIRPRPPGVADELVARARMAHPARLRHLD